jgi:hypothetical protein
MHRSMLATISIFSRRYLDKDHAIELRQGLKHNTHDEILLRLNRRHFRGQYCVSEFKAACTIMQQVKPL